jgi:hypothetical protein
MGRMSPAGGAELSEFETLWIVLFVFLRGIVAALTGCASQRDHNAIFFTFACHMSSPCVEVAYNPMSPPLQYVCLA